jgi:hypothetical protein
MSLVGFSLELAGDVSSFTPSVRTQMQGAIAARAAVHPSAVMVAVMSGSVIVGVRIHTPTAMATLVQSAMASATNSPSSATSMLASVTGVSIAVLAVVTPPTVTDVAPPPPPPPSPSRLPPPQRPPGALSGAGGGAITIIVIAVLVAIVALLCCLTIVCRWIRRRGRVELRRKNVNHMLTLNVSVSTVSADDDSVGIEMSGRFNYHSSETEGSSRADGAEGGARPAKSGVIGRLGSDPNHTPTVTESPRTNQDMVRQQKEEAMVISEGATVVHQPPWKGSSACSDPDFFIGTDSHDKGEHQLGDHVLHKEGAVGGGHGLGNGGGRVSSAGCRVSVGSGGASLSSSEDEPGGRADTSEANMQREGGKHSSPSSEEG